MTKTQAAAYLAAFIDGEGCVRTANNRSVSVSNTDWELIEAVVECCELLGLPHRIVTLTRQPPRKSGWEVFIAGKKSLEIIRDVVPMRSHRKRAALIEAIAAYKNKPRPPREWVEQKYVNEGLSLAEVARAWGLKNNCRACAHAWLRFYGIPARSISEANRNYQRKRAVEHG